jgi:hypothetical protein
MPGKSFQSKLEPHFDFILEMRRQPQTWEAIAQLLATKGITTTKQAVHAFIKRRLKCRYPLGLAPVETRSATLAFSRAGEPAAELPKMTPAQSEDAASRLTSPLPAKGPLWKQT